ncbi:MAG: hypothetical protein FJX40_13675 [Alphaproteobacteria bacterium]|nr:hypothetical protein [Alphaproteobacteria bacterium]MBM3641844.1 hypothetical protein [Alphaproteobacteria bacterium]
MLMDLCRGAEKRRETNRAGQARGTGVVSMGGREISDPVDILDVELAGDVFRQPHIDSTIDHVQPGITTALSGEGLYPDLALRKV